MTTLFENEQFRLLLTGHDYDFVGIIETKTEKPLTFFFEEELMPDDEDDEDCDWVVNEDETQLKGVFENLKPYEDSDDVDEAEDIAFRLSATSYFRTRDDKSTGFLSEPRERGQFLALVKKYCPERLKDIAWA